MIVQLSDPTRNAKVAAVSALCDGGSIKIYDGSMPAPSAGAAGTLLVTIPLDADAFGDPAAGTIAANDLDPVNWTAAGTADYYRVCKADGSLVWQGDVTDSAGDGSLKLSSVTAVIGSPVDVTSCTYSQPSGV